MNGFTLAVHTYRAKPATVNAWRAAGRGYLTISDKMRRPILLHDGGLAIGDRLVMIPTVGLSKNRLGFPRFERVNLGVHLERASRPGNAAARATADGSNDD